MRVLMMIAVWQWTYEETQGVIFPNFDVPVSSPPHSQYDQKQEYAPGWGLRMKFKTFFMNDEEKHGRHLYLPHFFNMSNQLLAPGGLNTVCVQVM